MKSMTKNETDPDLFALHLVKVIGKHVFEYSEHVKEEVFLSLREEIKEYRRAILTFQFIEEEQRGE